MQKTLIVRRTRQQTNVPSQLSYTFTGKTMQMVSPLTGKLTTYLESNSIHVTQPSVNPDLEGIKTQINTDATAQQVDGFCDTVLLVQGTLQDTYKTRNWVAEEQSMYFASHPYSNQRPLFPPLVIALILLTIIIAIIAVVAILLVSSFMAVADKLLPSKPRYTGGDPNNPTTYDDWAQYMSGQNLFYWYVCPKCGAGFGLKSTYPNVADVPQAEVDLFNQHVEMCLGLPQTNYDSTPFFAWAIIALAGVGIAGYVIVKGLGSRTAKEVGSLAKRL